MHLYKLIIFLPWLIASLFNDASGQKLDSLLSERQSKLQDYTQFKNNMSERTWINLIQLNELAGKVINTDNDLLWNHLDEEIVRNRDYQALNEQLRIEMAFLNKEKEQTDSQLKEHTSLNNLFLMIILGLSVALIILLASIISLYKKNKEAFYELRRLWSMNDDQSIMLQEREKALNKQMRLLEIENKAMQKELADLSAQKNSLKQNRQKADNPQRKKNQGIINLSDQIKKKSG